MIGIDAENFLITFEKKNNQFRCSQISPQEYIEISNKSDKEVELQSVQFYLENKKNLIGGVEINFIE